ncbi:Acidic mammalian chitinase [Hypsibius exemplaris]|uniref:Acidic mammalian chitinase n=1 Tax=Hypsibius exemplaris TaxID=2072580 RepID=A0A1W0X5S8_HYPEX|nr:Acidic mammalian chitinase [Hypsibius exemplaris]
MAFFDHPPTQIIKIILEGGAYFSGFPLTKPSPNHREMSSHKRIISAYFNANSTPGALQPEQIDGALMTHLIVGWASMSPTGELSIPQDNVDIFHRCAHLKRQFKHLKVMLVCGGGDFAGVSSSATLRKNFADSAIALIEACEFDGLDLDWEFPVWNGKRCERANFVLLLQDLRVAFDAHSPRFLLSFAGGAPKSMASTCYDIPGIAPSVDFVNLMCYDFNMFKYYNVWASHNAPLFRRPEQTAFFATLNTASAAEYWMKAGMPREKIVVGIPTYARAWRLLFPCWHIYNAMCTGSFSTPTMYPEVCALLANGATRVFDNHASVPYAYKGRMWISYEDEESITGKAEWIRKNGFGGAMIFSLNHDDWKGSYSPTGTPFPLICAVSRVLMDSKTSTTFSEKKKELEVVEVAVTESQELLLDN